MQPRQFLAILGLTLALSCSYRYRRDGLQRLEQQVAGPVAVDCGEVRPGDNPRDVDRCAVAAFRAGQPFIARYFNDSIDSTVAIVLIRAPSRKTIRVYYDSAPCGGPNCPERIIQRPCETPHVVGIESGERVTCE